MLVQREIHNTILAELLQNIDEIALLETLDLSVEESKTDKVKIGTNNPFKPFKAIKMRGEGSTASQMLINDRF